MKYISDEEIDLNLKDYLNTKPYSEALLNIITDLGNTKTQTIGLFGEWGSGKSSIIQTFRSKFDKIPRCKSLYYDAWKYSNDSFRRTFLMTINNQFNFHKEETFESFYSNSTEDVKILKKPNWSFLALIILSSIISILLINLIDKDKYDFKISLSIAVSAFSIIIAILKKSFDELKLTINRPLIFAPEQFEKIFNQMILDGLSNYRKIVIIIDNIDRCPKNVAYELLTTIKNFITIQEGITFILPVDERALQSHIKINNNCNDKEALEFLRKFFNIALKIKPFKEIDAFDFASQLATANGLKFKPTTIDIISKEYATNPRRIIQAFNNLITELECLSVNERTKSLDFTELESVVAKFLIIKEEWPEYYFKIAQNPNILQRQINIDDLKDYSGLEKFLRATQAITNDINVKVLDSIISHSDSDFVIDTDLLGYITSKNYEKLLQHPDLGTEGGQHKLINILTIKIKTGLERQLYDTEVLNALETLLVLNRSYSLSKDHNLIIESIIASQLSNFIEKVDLTNDNLVYYSKSLYNQKRFYLFQFMFNSINSVIKPEITELNTYWSVVLSQAIRIYDDLESLSKFDSAFFILFQKLNKDIISYDIPDANIQYVVNPDLLSHLVSKFTGFDHTDWNEILYVSKHKKIKIEIAESLFLKISSVYPNFNEKSNETIALYLEQLNIFMGNIDLQKLSNSSYFQIIYNSLTTPRPLGQITSNYLEGIKNEVNLVLEYVEFCKNIYLLSEGGIKIHGSLNSLFATNANKKCIYDSLNKINKKRYLDDFIPLICSDNEYDELFSELFSTLIKEKKNRSEDYAFDISLFKNKIIEIINLLAANSNIDNDLRNRLTNLMTILLNESRVEKLIIDYITTLPAITINALPAILYNLTFDVISKDIFAYQNNIELLKAIAKQGKKNHKDILTNLLISLLPKSETIPVALQIISEIATLSTLSTGRLISELKALNTDDSNLIESAKAEITRLEEIQNN